MYIMISWIIETIVSCGIYAIDNIPQMYNTDHKSIQTIKQIRLQYMPSIVKYVIVLNNKQQYILRNAIIQFTTVLQAVF